ncbi:cytochrome aa3 quinol oxidase subunit II [Bacillus sp. FJAT-49736]|uniref:cytochrome aa3 quinol oxidase subunit II n=1 Tax=Bacillus sp. FJAT-49736 TaxID=2833582 RepID=UPI001BC9F6D4|nr:cytochrome aa3 quinol oxidase subunit II [Bacillus sp. FJAT-49736]MBS4174845.1 cytochrome aa3 quinol oxidase subunit II [Bacillus sp. FJAT-49736]
MKTKKLPWKSLLFIFVSSLFLLSGCDTSKIAVLNPQGPVAQKQYDLIVYSFWLMMIILVVVLGLFIYMVYKYRAKKLAADYVPPDEHGSKWLEIIWTAIPVVIIIAVAIPTIKANYALEEVPKGYENKKPIVINVTSANWKWIFSYPEQNIETVNYVNIPAGRPVKFQLTSAGTMASFWVPELGGQKYTMPNHSMQLILLADKPGSYEGRNSNFNGEGFAHMDFEVLSQTPGDFDKWVKDVKGTASKMKKSDYNNLLKEGLVGRMTFTGTHLPWVTTPHQHGMLDQKETNQKHHNMDNMDMGNMDMSGHKH